jgi:hypothetical protein
MSARADKTDIGARLWSKTQPQQAENAVASRIFPSRFASAELLRLIPLRGTQSRSVRVGCGGGVTKHHLSGARSLSRFNDLTV